MSRQIIQIHKDRKHRELFLKLNELNNSKIELKNKINALKQIISHIEEVKDDVKFKSKQLKKKIKTLPRENPFEFTEYVEKQKKKKTTLILV